jgi:hypothetical protein
MTDDHFLGLWFLSGFIVVCIFMMAFAVKQLTHPWDDDEIDGNQ